MYRRNRKVVRCVDLDSEMSMAIKQAHLLGCRACRIDEATRTLLAFDGTDGIAEPLHDLAKRAWINEIIDKSKSCRDIAITTETPVYRRRSKRFLSAIAAAFVVMMLPIVFFLLGVVGEETDSLLLENSSRLTMRSGVVTTTAHGLQINCSFRDGDIIETGAGTAVVRLAGGVTIHLDEYSRVTLSHPNAVPPRIYLHHGEIISAVEHRDGELAFTVETDAGDVAVKGTVFRVSAHHHMIDVLVLEGQVHLKKNDDSAFQIKGGERLQPGSLQPVLLSQTEMSILQQQAAPLRLLEPNPPVHLTLSSRPSGARVIVDDVLLGKTPLSVHLNSGTHYVALEKSGYQTLRHTIEMLPGKSLTHDVVLAAAPESEVEQPLDTDLNPVVSTENRAVASRSKQASAPSLCQLLTRVRQQRKAENWRGAKQTYRQILAMYGKEKEAGVVRIGLAEIYLVHQNKPMRALKLYDTYLKLNPGGVLATEAAYGRARVFRALGLVEKEKTALKNFVSRFPNAIQATAARARLEIIR